MARSQRRRSPIVPEHSGELGRVERTLFLLRFISSVDIRGRLPIRAETTKIEGYNDFLDWVSFGGPVIKSGDPRRTGEAWLKYAQSRSQCDHAIQRRRLD